MNLPMDRRPVIVALAGPNGAGKTTFYRSHLRSAGLRLVNADVLSKELHLDPYAAADAAAAVREELVRQRESFVFETVFNEHVGEKVAFLKAASQSGYKTIVCFIGNNGPRVSEQRVAMRISKGGHSVPKEKLAQRFPRALANLMAAFRELPAVWVFDNNNLGTPYRLVAIVEDGHATELQRPIPKWLAPLLPKA
jgi:predicted ABC-type ATPase